jgi:hypothetical protein
LLYRVTSNPPDSGNSRIHGFVATSKGRVVLSPVPVNVATKLESDALELRFVGLGVGVGVGGGVAVATDVGVSVGMGMGVAVASGVDVGAVVSIGSGVGSGCFMVRAKMLKESTWAVAVDASKSTVVRSGVHVPLLWR